MEIGIVKQITVEEEMRNSYLDYAMSVIVSRALPDVRDGLKPSQRRVLVSMHDLNLAPGRAVSRSAPRSVAIPRGTTTRTARRSSTRRWCR